MDRKLIRPRAIEEALREREKYGRDALPIAGGQSLLVLLRNKLVDPQFLLDLQTLAELEGMKSRDGGLAIGAMTTIHTLASSRTIQTMMPVLAQGASKVGSTAIRNMGTIGGNLCHNEPGADLPPVLLALNAVAELRSSKGSRKIPLRKFFHNYFETVVTPEELVCSIEVPALPRGASGVYLKHAISSEDLAIAGVAVVLVPDEKRTGVVREARIALGGVAPVPLRAIKAEAVVSGAELNDETIRGVAEIAASEADPMTDPHGSAEYRTKMVKVLVRRAITAAAAQRNGNGKA